MAITTLQNRYRDIDISLIKNPKTSDIYTLTDVDAVKRSVRTLVMTNFSERVFHPEIGSGVYGSLFENFCVETSIILETAIRTVINNFEPRARIINVNVKQSIDNHSLDIEIFFNIVNVQDQVSVRVNLERVR